MKYPRKNVDSSMKGGVLHENQEDFKKGFDNLQVQEFLLTKLA